MWTFEEARNFIEQTSRFGSVLGLENMQALMNVLENPQNDIPIIHIAGTNGKGSVGAYLASIFREAGRKVGRYCSPAVFDPLECWQYDGRNITKEEYASCLSQVKNACDIAMLKGIQPTVFEIETAMAFVYFKQMQVDVLLLETGMGGATDATNVVANPWACVFTTISRDHMQFLGETLTEIATVKSGIIKPGAHAFSADQEAEVMAVLNRKIMDVQNTEIHEAGEKDTGICYVEKTALQLRSQKPGELTFSYKGKEYTTSLAGTYQMRNAALAIEVAKKLLQELCERSENECTERLVQEKIEHVVYRGIEKAVWSGRFEVIGQEPLFIIDGAHNEDAVKQLAISIEKSFTNQSVDFIIGILADKEHEKMLELMMPFANRIFTVTPPNARGLDGRILAEEVKVWHEDVLFCETIEEAVRTAVAHGMENGCPILAFGSLSYLGELKENYKQIRESRMRNV